MEDRRQTQQEIYKLILNKLTNNFGVSLNNAKKEDIYKAVLLVIREILDDKHDFFTFKMEKENKKKIYYLCMEFLVGPSLRNNLYNLGLTNAFENAIRDLGYEIEDFYHMESDPGLGNGGLGRLAACFMDSLATLNYGATGFSLLYEFGIFKQKIVDGWQTEMPDAWMGAGDVWLDPAFEQSVEVKFDGELSEQWVDGELKTEYKNYTTVVAVPYDMFISGKDSLGVSLLRLWKSKAPQHIDMASFMSGDYIRAMEESSMAEVISKVLYPADNHPEGKSLRLRQQYFLVSASVQNIIKKHLSKYKSLDSLPKYTAIHINDTHPALVIPELMRLLLDEYHYEWEAAWKIVNDTVCYTNHTVLAEALETWPESIFKARLPRIYSIVCEINRRFCAEAFEKTHGNFEAISRMAITAYDHVRMANLSVVGAKKVNGVSRLHSDIIKETIFKDFYEIYPEKFTNVTNGIAHRRWLCQANPELTKFISDSIGDGFIKNAAELEKLKQYKGDVRFLNRLAEIKRCNKVRLSNLIMQNNGTSIDPDSVFDVHIKRMHEYKRQHLNAMHILSLYLDMKENRQLVDDSIPRTFIFAAKAAPGYYLAKQIIRFIYSLADLINPDPDIKGKLKIVFEEDYKVSLAEIIIPAAEISEQISQAGKEASGTGNMKLMINGAVTLGTYDGANVEIHEAVGDDHIFIFGLRDHEIRELQSYGYEPSYYYNNNPKLRRVLDYMNSGIKGVSFSDLAQQIITGDDPYMVAADFESYEMTHQRVMQTYAMKNQWNEMALENIASAGRFAADRSIKDYADTIWSAKPVKK